MLLMRGERIRLDHGQVEWQNNKKIPFLKRFSFTMMKRLLVVFLATVLFLASVDCLLSEEKHVVPDFMTLALEKDLTGWSLVS